MNIRGLQTTRKIEGGKRTASQNVSIKSENATLEYYHTGLIRYTSGDKTLIIDGSGDMVLDCNLDLPGSEKKMHVDRYSITNRGSFLYDDFCSGDKIVYYHGLNFSKLCSNGTYLAVSDVDEQEKREMKIEFNTSIPIKEGNTTTRFTLTYSSDCGFSVMRSDRFSQSVIPSSVDLSGNMIFGYFDNDGQLVQSRSDGPSSISSEGIKRYIGAKGKWAKHPISISHDGIFVNKHKHIISLVIYPNGDMVYTGSGKTKITVSENGKFEFYKGDKRHNELSVAVFYQGCHGEFWLDGKRLSPEEWAGGQIKDIIDVI